ncbi:MAG: PD40 domain-containing protein [Bryobacterales bacterium]|nr:PD40 domain-containing protein [Bryobacterales bacterium]
MPTNLMRWKTTVGATMLIAAFAAAQQADRADLMMEAAARKERVDGDLKAAIEQYRKVATQFAKQPGIAAKALLQMGQCQEKLGQAEARKSYERIVREYGGAQEYASVARARIAALLGRTTPAGGMNLRRVDSGERFRLVKGVSRDGRLIGFSYFDSGGSQGLYDTVTREEKILVKLEWTGDVYGASPALSRDGQWLAFGTYENKGQNAELRLVRADGSGMRTLHRLTGSSWVIPKDWTPDNRQVLAQISSQGTTYLCLVSVADGAVKRLKQVSGGDQHAFVSPDGAFIVYVAGAPKRSGPATPDEGPDPGLQDTKVHIMMLNGGGDQALLPSGPVARPMGWSPDGKGVLLLSRKSGEPGLWFVPVADGKALGEPKLLRSGMPAGTWPAGLTADGRFYFVEEVQKSDSYLVQLNAGSGAPGKPARVTHQFEGSNGYSSWSPDGKKLAWFGLSYSGTLLHVRDLASGREKSLAFPVTPGFLTPQWLADHRTIIYLSGGASQPDKRTLHAFDTETSESRLIADNISNFPTVSSDGSMIYMVRGEPGFRQITALDTRTKTERELASLDGSIFHLAVSPDGRSLACVVLSTASRRLVLVDTQTGQTREFGETQARAIPFFRRSISWTPDGTSVVLRTNDGVWAYPAAGGERKLLFRADGPIQDVAISPDGKSLAYTQTSAENHLWVLENFLPVASAQKR